MTPQILSPSQFQEFHENGYLIIRDGFPSEVASNLVDRQFDRMGYLRNDPSTWKDARVVLPLTTLFDVAEFAPKIWKAVCDLLGGQERIRQPAHWSDEFIFNLGIGADKPWTPPSAKAGGWHKDGEGFRHFLDSPELALITIVCWTDMKHQGGGTFIAPDSIGPVARFLADHPEGLLPTDRQTGALIADCKQFVELTGNAGDVVLLHPYMLHAASQNVLRVERAITNQSVRLKEPMNFNRDNVSDFSPVERGVLRGLGVDRFDFQPTHPREKIVPERFRMQKAERKM